ncbi:MAG: hypothetical protein M3P28_04750 [Thermoproteota archaeon]|nr:hypothetical protein [Thermoproteota archaeon]
MKLDSFVRKPSFELFLGLLTLSSVILALVLYVPEIELSPTQNNIIYIFDFFVVGVLAFDFFVRTKASNAIGKLHTSRIMYSNTETIQ